MAARSRKNAKTTKKASSKSGNRRASDKQAARSAKNADSGTAAKKSRKKTGRTEDASSEKPQPGGDHRIRDEIISIMLIAVGIFLVIALQTSAAGELGRELSEFFKDALDSRLFCRIILFCTKCCCSRKPERAYRIVLLAIIFLGLLINSAQI